ncbi:aminotransferase class IV [Planctomonas psychrotolerans]|uniref:aminotransferase class IV n=1 Tax=Planctomonas psychrotolerans TaxID=2528712 RepID=UPI001D0D2418|nr:aminotransferase class IV [Planctomonas psychrotolerans]
MHSTAPIPETRFRWDVAARRLVPEASAPSESGDVVVADSWLVIDGTVRALAVHRERFLSTAVPAAASLDPAGFFDAAVRALPRTGDLFPRVDLRLRGTEATLSLTLRPAPACTTSVVLGTHDGADPRRVPAIKGPDLEALGRLRSDAASRGIDEVVLVAADGSIIDGAYSAVVWWRGDALCVPDAELARVDSVTARTLVTLATALGIDVLHERARPDSLDGHEVWVLNALQGIRIAREWRGGPALAADPGRLALWRERLTALRRSLPA